MKKLFAVISFLVFNVGMINSQKNEIKESQYEAKIQNLIGVLDLTFHSSDIIEYNIKIIRTKNDTLFSQKGFAINPSNYLWAKHGEEYPELIGPDMNNSVSAKQFLVYCKCDTWLNFKIPADYSYLQVDCGQELLNRLSGNNSNQSPETKILGYFYLKKK